LSSGASGRVGGALATAQKRQVDMRLTGKGPVHVPLDFLDPQTFRVALDGCDSVFLMRPPQIASGRAFRPFLDAAQDAGVGRMIVLSAKGAESNPILPHHGVEREVMARGFDWTMLRPADFMQNFETMHHDDICLHDRIAVPAERGASAFIALEFLYETRRATRTAQRLGMSQPEVSEFLPNCRSRWTTR